MNKIKPELIHYWKLIKDNNDKSFNFLKSFWFYLQDQTLEFTYQYIETFPKIEETKYETSYQNNQFNYYKDNIIELLGNFFHLNSASLKNSIELLFEFVTRKPDKLPELIHKIRELLIFDREDERFDFIDKRLFSIY
jgi:site-specific DNA-adenine methylase